MNTKQNKYLEAAFIPLAIGLNIGIGALVKGLNLPLYLDSIGTIIATLMMGWKRGAIVGVIGFVITSIFFNPLAIYFCGTQLVIALVTSFLGKRRMFSNIWKTVVSGIIIGLASAIASAGPITYLFHGATGNGAALVTSFFLKMGNQILQAVLLSGISIEPIDKGLQAVLAYLVLVQVPSSLLTRFNNGSLRENFVVDEHKR